LALPGSVKHWSQIPTYVGTAGEAYQDRAEVVAQSRYVFFQMAEVAVPEKLFRAALERIRRLRPREPVTA
jgi:hypothetical protein